MTSKDTDLPADARWQPLYRRLGLPDSPDSADLLTQACALLGLEPQSLQAAGLGPDWPLRLGALADAIEVEHHDFIRCQGYLIQRLFDQIDEVPSRHVLWRIQQRFNELHQGLLQHLRREESILFPYCRLLDHCRAGLHQRPLLMIRSVHLLGHDHDQSQRHADALQDLCDDFLAPPGSSRWVGRLYTALGFYCRQLVLHTRMEDQLLFPAALRREQELAMGEAPQDQAIA